MWLLAGGVGGTTGAAVSDAASVSAGFGLVAASVGRAVESALTSVVATGSALFVGGGLVVAGAPGPYVLAAVFVVKLLGDVGGHDRLFGTETLVVAREDRRVGLAHVPRTRSRPASTDIARTGPPIRAL